MRTGCLGILSIWMLGGSSLLAQSLPPPPDVPTYPPVTSAPAPVLPGSDPTTPMRFWVRGELLAYWVKGTPLPVSLVTGDPNNPTQELLNADRDFGVFTGFRLGVGIPLQSYDSVGLDLSMFSLQPRTRRFSAWSDSTGSPILAFPFANQTPGAEGDTIWAITSPGQFAGGINVSNTLALWGLETNAAFYLYETSSVGLVGLVGFRYADLRERLIIDTLSAALATTPNTILFQSDQFRTRNQFYGGQVGARFRMEGERLGLDVTGKVAFGATRGVVDVHGFSAQTGPGGVNGTFPGGFFSQPSNLGRQTGCDFSVMPSVELKLSWLISSNLRLFVGYDFLYWTQVVRPGCQVDRNINLTQTGAIFSNGGPNGPALPGPLFTRSDFWAQGITLGLELRY